MVYSSRFVMTVLLGGQVQPERPDGVVLVPFGAEYSLRFRNKHDRRAVVRFTIDGEEASGGGYVIPARSAVDIRRYFHRDAAFRFVDLNSPEAADFGKSDNLAGDKGVIEARFFLERPPVTYQAFPHDPLYDPHRVFGASYGGSGGGFLRSRSFSPQHVSEERTSGGIVLPDQLREAAEGCTMEGGASGQRFTPVSLDLESDYVTLRLVLRGYVGEVPTQTVEATSRAATTHCTRCGAKRGRKTDRFCGQCGQRLD